MPISTITYSDKSDINVNSSVPSTNKVQAIDMNEINKVLSKFLVERPKDETNGITLTSKAILDTRDKYLSRLDKFAEDYLGIKLTVY
ncbi:MAG: hypothetical protein IIT65_02585, partial [Lachnospiraceae bacterium]|nr:hypothetical protein [Lachnospiraceae bacterium]